MDYFNKNKQNNIDIHLNFDMVSTRLNKYKNCIRWMNHESKVFNI